MIDMVNIGYHFIIQANNFRHNIDGYLSYAKLFESSNSIGYLQLFRKRLGVSLNAIAAFCQRWNIIEFAVFGSILQEDFRPDSDIDVLVEFKPEFKRGLIETRQMKD